MIKYFWAYTFFIILSVKGMSGGWADIQNKDFSLEIPTLTNQGWIPAIHACERLGQNRSPKFQWKNPPLHVKSFSLVCTDPDAPEGLFTHWIIYNIPAQVNHLDEEMARMEKLSDGSLQGINSFKRVGYDGPCPPGNSPHRYFFTLYALGAVPRSHFRSWQWNNL
jgi:Raf kinase inhibitor-like YbhB/YbcL family protein